MEPMGIRHSLGHPIDRGLIAKSSFRSSVLGGSWVVVSGVVGRLSKVIAHIRGLITPLITTHEPPSRDAEWRPILVSDQTATLQGLRGLGCRV